MLYIIFYGEQKHGVPISSTFVIDYVPCFYILSDDESSEIENLIKRAMPWLGEEICIKDTHTQNTTMPGLSLVQWMNMNKQQSPSLASMGIQSEYLRSLSNPAMQNLSTAELARQLYMQNHLLQQNSMQLSAPKLSQQMQPTNELSKGACPFNQLDAIINQQEQKQDAGDQQRQQQTMNQAIPLSHVQTNNVQAQVILQNPMQQQQQPSPTKNTQETSGQQLPLSHQQQDQNLHLQQQQQLLLQQLQRQQQQQNQQQLNNSPGQLVNLGSQHSQPPDQELQLKILQKLQQQTLMPQPTVTLSRLPLIQEQQKLLLDMQQQLPNSYSVAQQRMMTQQDSKVSLQESPVPSIANQDQQQKILQKQVTLANVSDVSFPSTSSTHAISKGGSTMILGAAQSALTEEIPSCSASPSTDNRSLAHPTIDRNKHCKINTEKVPQSTALMSIPTSAEAVIATPIVAKDLSKLNHNVQQNVITSKSPIGGTGPENLVNTVPSIDNLETASSSTSLWSAQADGLLHQGFSPLNFNQQPLFKDALPDVEIQGVDPTNSPFFGINNDGPLGFPMETEGLLVSALNPVKCQNHTATNAENNYRMQKDAHQEISTSMVSQSFGQSDVAFNSIDSAINDGAVLNRNSWPSAPPPQRMRTFTKVSASRIHSRPTDSIIFKQYISINVFT
jgi:hypothetical protein